MPTPSQTKQSQVKPGRFAQQTRVPLAGSDKAAFNPGETPSLSAAAAVDDSAPARPGRKPITVSVVLRPRTPIDSAALLTPGYLRLSRARFAKLHGPDPASLKLVNAFAAEFNLSPTAPTPGRRTVQLTGSEADLARAFGVTFDRQPGVPYRLRVGVITLPEELAPHIQAVLGLDDRPQAQSHFRVSNAKATNVSYTPVQVGQLYGIPSALSAAGQTIALIELGGGYRTADLTAYFKTLGRPAPSVVAVSVDKGKNAPTTASGADGEVMLDIEVAAALAPGARIAVYFAPNTDQGFIDAIATAVHDTINNPSVISISWGGPESTWTQQSITALDQACQAAAALGITITVACGDNGSTDGVTGTANHVDFPASSPHVLACGGTKLTVTGTKILAEVVWNELAANEGATGGGVSNVFPLPTWQSKAGVPKSTSSTGGRGLPDVAGDADPATGYSIRVDGQTIVIGGTSAVAPLWAGLIALANAQGKTTAGFLNPTLYAAKQTSLFNDITQGTNGGFSAGPGWDACTGLGSPVGAAIIQAVSPSKTRPVRSKHDSNVSRLPATRSGENPS